MSLKKSLKIKNKIGQTVIEYTLVLTLIAVLAFTIFSLERIRGFFQAPVNQVYADIGGVKVE